MGTCRCWRTRSSRCSPPLPAASRSMPRSAAVGTPSGSWRRPILMAASSVWTPIGRPSPGSRADLERFGDRLVLRQANFRAARRRRARGGVRGRRRGAVRPGPVVVPAGGRRAGLRLPGRRAARHAVRHDARRPGHRAAGEPGRRRADGALPAYGEEPYARRIARAIVEARRDGADRDGRRAGDARRAGRSRSPRGRAPHPSGNARLPGAPDRGQRGARRSRGGACRGRRPAAAGRPPRRPLATTPWRTGSSSGSSTPSGGAAPARRSCPSASADAQPRLRLVDATALTPTRGGDRRQSPLPQRPLRAAERLAASHRTRSPATDARRHSRRHGGGVP